MANYDKKEWLSNEVIATEELNNIENGIASAHDRITDVEDKLAVASITTETLFNEQAVLHGLIAESVEVICDTANMATVAVHNTGAGTAKVDVFVNFTEGGMFNSTPKETFYVATGKQASVTMLVNFYALKVQVTAQDSDVTVSGVTRIVNNSFDDQGVNVYNAERLGGQTLAEVQDDVDSRIAGHASETASHGVFGYILGSDDFNAAGGVPQLDGNTQILETQIPETIARNAEVADAINALQSTYDTDGDGKVNAADAADSVPWTGVTGKPSTFPPETHGHDQLHDHANKATIDGITSVGSGAIITSTERTKLNGIESGAQVNLSTSQTITNINNSATTLHPAKVDISTSAHTDKYVSGGNYPFVQSIYGPTIRAQSNDVHEYWGNSIWFADKKGVLTTSGGVTFPHNVFRTGDTFSTITNDSGPCVFELALSMNNDTMVTEQRLYIQAHGNIVGDLQVELKDKDGIWHTLASEAISIIGKEYWFSPTLVTAVPWPDGWPLTGLRVTFSNVTSPRTYVRQIGVFSYVGKDCHPFLERIGGTLHGNLNVENGGIIQVDGNKVWHQGNDGAGSGLDADLLDGNHASAFEQAFTKNTAFNKNFGTAAGTVCQGNDTRLSNDRTPLTHGDDKHSVDYATSSELTTHTGNTSNPHGVTAAQVGAIPTADKGVAGGVASLDASGFLNANNGRVNIGTGGKYLRENGTNVEVNTPFECPAASVKAAASPAVTLTDTTAAKSGSVVYNSVTDSIDFVFG